MKTDKKEYNGPGIYALINVYNLAVYIGCTRHVITRSKSHYSSLKNNKHPNKKMQKYYNGGKYRFIVLERLPEDISDFKLHLLERMYIYDFCKRRNYIVCNREAENIDRLKDLIFFDIFEEYSIRQNTNKAFKNEYGIDTWNMINRKRENRCD